MKAIELTDPFDTGDLDGSYTHVIVSNMYLDYLNGSYSANLDYGRMESSVWHSGVQYKAQGYFPFDPSTHMCPFADSAESILTVAKEEPEYDGTVVDI